MRYVEGWADGSGSEPRRHSPMRTGRFTVEQIALALRQRKPLREPLRTPLVCEVGFDQPHREFGAVPPTPTHP